MPSTLTWRQTTEQPGLGEATVVFTDGEGAVIATYTDRVDTRSGESIQEFVDHALKAKAQAQAQITEMPKVLLKIQAILDAAESK